MDRKALARDAFAFEVLDTLAWLDDAPDFDPTSDLVLLESLWRERMQADGEGRYTTATTSGRT